MVSRASLHEAPMSARLALRASPPFSKGGMEVGVSLCGSSPATMGLICEESRRVSPFLSQQRKYCQLANPTLVLQAIR